MQASSDYRIDYLAKEGINFQHFDYNFYKIKDDILLYFPHTEATESLIEDTTLKYIGALIESFIEIKNLCESIDWIHYYTKGNVRKIHISMNWPNIEYKASQFSLELMNYLNRFEEESGAYWKDNKLFIKLDEELYYMEDSMYYLAINTLKDFLCKCISNNCIYILPAHSTDD